MQDFPLLDLQSAWQDARQCLKEVQTIVERLYAVSDRTWYDMLTMRAQVDKALSVLATMPPGIVEGIAKDEADWDELESHNPN